MDFRGGRFTWQMPRTAVAALALLAAAAAPAHAEAKVGVMADVGLPDGGTVSAVVQPIRPLRFRAGVGHNGIAPGIRGGVTLVPLPTSVTPTLTADVGAYREGDARPLARMLSGDEMLDTPGLDRIGYRYAAARVGLEIGRDRFTMYLHAGAARLWGRVHADDPADVTITSVSARLGFILYL